jgi:tetratricopeptide (TPR) repeat protein
VYCAPDLSEKKEKSKEASNAQPKIEVKMKPAPESLQSFITCLDFYYKANGIIHNLDDNKRTAFEVRELFKILLNPIMGESRKMTAFQLNDIYPELGTQFYSKFIIGMKLFVSQTGKFKSEMELKDDFFDKKFLAKLDLMFNSKKIEAENQKLMNRAIQLVTDWETWLGENIDEIIKSLRQKYYLKKIKINKLTIVYLAVATSHLKKKELDQALVAFNKAVELDPNNIDLYHYRGQCYTSMEKYQEAIKDFDHVIQNNDVDASAYFWRGYAYFYLKNYKSSKENYYRAIEIQPKFTEAYFNLACIHSIEKDLDKATERLTQCIQLDREFLALAKKEADLENLRKDARWKDIMKKFKAKK